MRTGRQGLGSQNSMESSNKSLKWVQEDVKDIINMYMYINKDVDIQTVYIYRCVREREKTHGKENKYIYICILWPHRMPAERIN